MVYQDRTLGRQGLGVKTVGGGLRVPHKAIEPGKETIK